MTPYNTLHEGQIDGIPLPHYRAANNVGSEWALIKAPHPAARMPDKLEQLRNAHLRLLAEVDLVNCGNCGHLTFDGGRICEFCNWHLYQETSA